MRFYSIPMTTRFRGLTIRDGVLLEGPAGWGEFSPFWEYDAKTSAPWLAAAQEAAEQGFPPAVRASIPVNVTIPACSAEQARTMAARGGCRTAKIKVAEPGDLLDEEIARVEAVRDVLGPGAKIRVDANGLWDVEKAVHHIRQLDVAAQGLEYVEQPCRRVEDLAAVRRRVAVPIAADESVRRAEDPLRVVRADAADILILKVQPLGGVRRCLELAEAAGLPVVVSSALETSIGISMGVALAAALPELPYACGLSTVHLLQGDVVIDSLVPVDGEIPVRRVSVDPDLAQRFRASDVATQRWEQRLESVYSHA